MTVIVKNKTPLVVPPAVRRQAGFKSGQEIEFKVSAGVISIRRKAAAAGDEYTSDGRRTIDARLAKADADIKAGRMSKAFSDDREFIADLNKETAKLSARKTRRPAK